MTTPSPLRFRIPAGLLTTPGDLPFFNIRVALSTSCSRVSVFYLVFVPQDISIGFCHSTKRWLPRQYLSSYPGRKGRWGGRKRFWSQLNHSKRSEIDHRDRDRDRRAIKLAHPGSPTSSLTTKTGGQKSPCQISGNRLEVDENVNRSHFYDTFAGCEVMR